MHLRNGRVGPSTPLYMDRQAAAEYMIGMAPKVAWLCDPVADLVFKTQSGDIDGKGGKLTLYVRWPSICWMRTSADVVMAFSVMCMCRPAL